jgi:hypothetical protein
MTRALRERFGLEGAPVDILYRARTRPEPGSRPSNAGPAKGRPEEEENPADLFDAEID